VRRALLELLVPSVCPGCDAERRVRDPLLCARCAQGLHPMRELRGVRSALAYEATSAELLRRLKFEGRRDGLPLLTLALADRLRGLRIDAVVPVPRHAARIRTEGCDPAHDLALGVARALGTPCWSRVLRRIRPTPPQTGLDRTARRVNVRRAFRARHVSGHRLLLLDDVTTTGATLDEASRALRAAGTRGVVRAAVAATPRHAL